MKTMYDLIVVGLGHAGAEAAHAAATMGLSVLGIDPGRGYVRMACGNSIGGVGKGQMVREIDALGGMTGIVADKSTLQFRMLNRSKGPAMWSPRSQNDRLQYAQVWQEILSALPKLDFSQDMAQALLIENQRVKGVVTQRGRTFYSQTVIMTTGTFLNGMIHIGAKKHAGGRMGEKASTGITEQLRGLGFETGRLKTGTSPRVDGRTLDYSQMEVQEGDTMPEQFSYLPVKARTVPQIYCHITHTNPQVHEILAASLHQSPMYIGEITGQGPRYCPSIEAKLTRFADKNAHTIFVQPEGWHTIEVYVNGFSISLPEEVQYAALRAVAGFQQVKILRPGYAIEYDYVPPTQLYHTLETRLIEGLYLAGQINGTTGYEEAAAQGIMAGINAARKVQGKPAVVLKRSDAYIGVLIDDLVTKGTEAEPYRIFTSRHERRIASHQGNADMRLTQLGYEIGLASKERYERLQAKINHFTTCLQLLHHCKLTPTAVNPYLKQLGSREITEKQSLYQLLKRPAVALPALVELANKEGQMVGGFSSSLLEQVSIQVKYDEYLQKEKELAEKLLRLENHVLPTTMDYSSIKGLSAEAKEKLTKRKPQTLGEASRISGVSAADVAILLLYARKKD